MKHIPRKRFGQHFLSDEAVIDAIVRAITPCPGQAVVEIGPGLAALTLLVAESDPKQKDTLIRLIMHMLQAA